MDFKVKISEEDQARIIVAKKSMLCFFLDLKKKEKEGN